MKDCLNIEAKCEACNSSQLESLNSENNIISGKIANKPLLGNLIFVKKGYTILHCPSCGLMTTDVPLGFDPNEIYTQDYFQGGMPDGYYDYTGSEHFLTSENSHRVNLVRSYKPEGKLLEIGCASGGFLLQAKNYFSVQGVDVSAFAIEIARRKGLDVQCGSLEESTIICPPYDTIVLFDTIEHLLHPRRTLKYIYSILCENGYIFITTGDTKSILARICGKHWRLMTPPQHLWFFNSDNITLLLQGLGFEVVAIRHLWRRVPLSLVWYQLFRGKMKPLPTILGKIVVPLNLYDTMTVIARK